ncbi:hypothetical protein M0D70_03195 [Acinetobacter portensis]|uniref:Uncharacterized protein n=2 Tax=Acinetobacter TaxID=469 RepID=A0A6L6GGR0_9GAMM|nr:MULTISPECIES: hypothetical protein [Acinetobacter]MCK7608405.1 hypothetical protein [Acinetobacter portensis]MCK7639180.1 hypothetical protein [Acinetobacter portensis]MDY6461519.1 hypothetical protein [Acinetobacter faecalis]MDY6483690.1 hypothetical protein [Acinetobacter faecalis]MDY6486969.1 hypothetical protein [Acinetobacter faecalis]
MKKIFKFIVLILFVFIAVIVYLAIAHPTIITKTALKPVIEYQCKTELQATKVWKTASIFMTEDEQQKSLSQVCGCVSEHATDDVAVKELIHALLDEQAKNELVSKAITNSVRGCVVKALNER